MVSAARELDAKDQTGSVVVGDDGPIPEVHLDPSDILEGVARNGETTVRDARKRIITKGHIGVFHTVVHERDILKGSTCKRQEEHGRRGGLSGATEGITPYGDILDLKAQQLRAGRVEHIVLDEVVGAIGMQSIFLRGQQEGVSPCDREVGLKEQVVSPGPDEEIVLDDDVVVRDRSFDGYAEGGVLEDAVLHRDKVGLREEYAGTEAGRIEVLESAVANRHIRTEDAQDAVLSLHIAPPDGGPVAVQPDIVCRGVHAVRQEVGP